jgi:hypothetical protein
MSYAAIQPPVYAVYQPDQPWHPGSSGWSRPYIPGWAQNPNLLDRHRYAIQGLGCGSGGCGCGCGTGQNNNGNSEATPAEPEKPTLDWPIYVGFAGLGMLLLLSMHMASKPAGR